LQRPCQRERGHARGREAMPEGERPCQRERGHARGREGMPEGEREIECNKN